MKFARWLVIVVSIAGILVAAASLVLIWKTAAGTAMPLPEPISETTRTSASLLLLAVTFLIAWRAGDHPPNVALALAFAFAFSNDAFYTLCKELQVNVAIGKAVNLSTFILGAGFYIRAAQRFPRTLTPLDIASSRTMWARIVPMRAVLTYFLHAPVVWLFVISATLLAEFIGPLQVTDATRLTIVLVGLIFIYIMYRSGDLETRRKVLWFFEMALASLIIGLLLQGVRAVLHDTGSPTLRLSIFVLLICANYLIYVICICSAVFYSGAISPALVIRKTFVYGVTAALLLFTYATVETFLVNFLVDKTGISDRFASTLLGTVLALAFHPIKNKMEHALRRLGPATSSTPAEC